MKAGTGKGKTRSKKIPTVKTGHMFGHRKNDAGMILSDVDIEDNDDFCFVRIEGVTIGASYPHLDVRINGNVNAYDEYNAPSSHILFPYVLHREYPVINGWDFCSIGVYGYPYYPPYYNTLTPASIATYPFSLNPDPPEGYPYEQYEYYESAFPLETYYSYYDYNMGVRYKSAACNGFWVTKGASLALEIKDPVIWQYSMLYRCGDPCLSGMDYYPYQGVNFILGYRNGVLFVVGSLGDSADPRRLTDGTGRQHVFGNIREDTMIEFLIDFFPEHDDFHFIDEFGHRQKLHPDCWLRMPRPDELPDPTDYSTERIRSRVSEARQTPTQDTFRLDMPLGVSRTNLGIGEYEIGERPWA